eukprot:363073-Chlamydomonas_euryale.AAC.8
MVPNSQIHLYATCFFLNTHTLDSCSLQPASRGCSLQPSPRGCRHCEAFPIADAYRRDTAAAAYGSNFLNKYTRRPADACDWPMRPQALRWLVYAGTERFLQTPVRQFRESTGFEVRCMQAPMPQAVRCAMCSVEAQVGALGGLGVLCVQDGIGASL